MNTYLMLLKREFWEHRSLWIAPAIWVGIIIVLFAWLVFIKMDDLAGESARAMLSANNIEDVASLSEKDREHLRQAMAIPEERAQTPLAFTYLGIHGLLSGFVIIVVFFYLIDCLFSERRDRSILFWKSLPVSDTQVVLSKFLVAMVVVPLGVIVLSALMQLLVLGIWTVRTSGTLIGQITPDWNLLSWLRAQGLELGLMLGGVMWYAPIAAYFMLLSVWARKLVILWAVVPLVAVPALEKFFMGSTHVLEFLGQRFGGFVSELNINASAFEDHHDGEHLPRVQDLYDALDLSGMFTSAEAWMGMAAAALMLFLAVRIRRYRDET
jgi:ABC-2 type transport system permease protein